MIETIDRSHCKMRHENGNCLPMGGFCTAVNDEICAALQAAHAWGMNELAKGEGKQKKGKWLIDGYWSEVFGMGTSYGYYFKCSECGKRIRGGYFCEDNFCPRCGADMRGTK